MRDRVCYSGFSKFAALVKVESLPLIDVVRRSLRPITHHVPEREQEIEDEGTHVHVSLKRCASLEVLVRDLVSDVDQLGRVGACPFHGRGEVSRLGKIAEEDADEPFEIHR
jgi:hypothetical protein